MEAIAKTKYLKGSPRKARLVIDLIRGVNVSRALSILKFTDKRAADPIAQCLNSAIANATYKAEQQNIAIDPDDLWVKACFVDMGPHKHRSRMRPAPQGRAYREQRHYCHITIEVTSEEKAKTEEQIRLEALRAERIAARKAAKAAEKAKAPVKKEAKATKVEETPVKDVTEEVVDTPVETVEEAPTAEATVETAEETPVAEEAPAAEAAVETAEEISTVEETPAAEEIVEAETAEAIESAEENVDMAEAADSDADDETSKESEEK